MNNLKIFYSLINPVIMQIITAIFTAFFSVFLPIITAKISKSGLSIFGIKSFKNLKLFIDVFDSNLEEPLKKLTCKHFTENLINEIFGFNLRLEQIYMIEKSNLRKKFSWKQIQSAINFFKFNEKSFEIKTSTLTIIWKWIAVVISFILIMFGAISISLDFVFSKPPDYYKLIFQDILFIIFGFTLIASFYGPRAIAIDMKKYLQQKNK